MTLLFVLVTGRLRNPICGGALIAALAIGCGSDALAPTNPDGQGDTTDPDTADPDTTDPGATDPGATDPGATNPDTTDPGVIEGPLPIEQLTVRYRGGETTDFGNGTNDFCSTSTERSTIDVGAARALAPELDAEQAWLTQSFIAPLHFNPNDCAAAPQVCEATEIELRASIVEYFRVDGRSGRLVPECEPEWQALAYRLLIQLATRDGNLQGAFYADASRIRSQTGEVTHLALSATPDLRNFVGTLPLRLELERPHFAFLDLNLELHGDGVTRGDALPRVLYYDGVTPFADIGPYATWNELGEDTSTALSVISSGNGSVLALSEYTGSADPALVALVVRANAVAPGADIDVTVRVNDEVVHQGSVPPGTDILLGEHPFGTRVSVDVVNSNGAGTVDASIAQDNCFVANETCQGDACVAHAEFTSGFRLCTN